MVATWAGTTIPRHVEPSTGWTHRSPIGGESTAQPTVGGGVGGTSHSQLWVMVLAMASTSVAAGVAVVLVGSVSANVVVMVGVLVAIVLILVATFIDWRLAFYAFAFAVPLSSVVCRIRLRRCSGWSAPLPLLRLRSESGATPRLRTFVDSRRARRSGDDVPDWVRCGCVCIRDCGLPTPPVGLAAVHVDIPGCGLRWFERHRPGRR